MILSLVQTHSWLQCCMFYPPAIKAPMHCRGLVVMAHHNALNHDDVIKWKDCPRNWPFMRGIHRSPVNSPYKGQWRGTLLFSLICVWINGWENNREAVDLRPYRAHYDVTVMYIENRISFSRRYSRVCISVYKDILPSRYYGSTFEERYMLAPYALRTANWLHFSKLISFTICKSLYSIKRSVYTLVRANMKVYKEIDFV